MSTEERTSTEERQGINWVQVVAAALAAVSSAVVLSTLGVAGTIIGAALGSLTASVGAAVYSRTIDASRQQVANQAATLKRVAQARVQVDDAVVAMQRGGAGSGGGGVRARAKLSQAEQALQDAEAHVEAGAEATAPTGPPRQREAADEPRAAGGQRDPLFEAEAGKRLPWKRVALVATGIFLVAMVAISSFELITGEAVSQMTGGSSRGTDSTIPGLAGGGGKSSPTPGPSTQPSDQPSGQPSGPASDQPSSQPSGEPSSTPSTSPSTSPSTVPTPTPSPTESSVPSQSVSPSPTPAG